MSKGSNRRPSAVSDAEVRRNWERTFPKGETMPWKKYVFEITVRETIIAKSEEDARAVLPSQPEGALQDWALTNVEDQ